MTDAVAALLRAHLCPATDAKCRAVMLSGGTTPVAAYERISATPFAVDSNVRILFSDDRHVPPEDPASNYGRVLPMLRALKIPDTRVTRVRGELPLDDAVTHYESDLRALLGGGCRVKLGLLGLGADGHTASLFSAEQIALARERLAIGVQRPDGMYGVSATPDFFARVEQIIFLVAGADKRDALRKLLRDPCSIPAGLAIRNHPRVEVWADIAASSVD